MEKFKKQLAKEALALNIELSDEQLDILYTYFEDLVETNKYMNLTAITEANEVITKHFIDSMSIVKLDNVSRETLSGKKIIDIGTGAGFPGLVLKIVFPEIKLTLSDSLMKRIKFLKELTEKLGLKDVECVHGRAEDLARRPEYRENFDIAVSRAVANLATLSEYDIPFVKKNGAFIAYKAGNMDDEIKKSKKAIKILGAEIESIKEFNLPYTDMERSLVLIRKKKETSKKYPRKAGTPSKDPII